MTAITPAFAAEVARLSARMTDDDLHEWCRNLNADREHPNFSDWHAVVDAVEVVIRDELASRIAASLKGA